jgi:hypothetical protein
MKTAILDFDDLCDTNDPYDTLVRLHDRDQNFKVTLFAIPSRCSPELLKKYDGIRDWCVLGIHGWRHSRHECLAWTSEETVEKIDKSLEFFPGFQKLFKAPNWEICDEVYQGLSMCNVAVADHIRNIEILPMGMKHYIYNVRYRDDPYQRLHGHIQPWAGTGLMENADADGINPLYSLPIGTPYAFCVEAVEANKRVAVG